MWSWRVMSGYDPTLSPHSPGAAQQRPRLNTFTRPLTLINADNSYDNR